MEKLLFICINYHNIEEVTEFAKHLSCKFPKKIYDLVIVNNSNSYEEFESLNKRFSAFDNIFICSKNENMGYLSGLNYGVQFYYSKKSMLPKWIILSNTDIIISNENFLTILNQYENIGKVVIAPEIISKISNTNQNPLYLKRPNKRYIKTLILIYRYTLVYNFHQFLFKFKQKNTNKVNEVNIDEQEIFSAHGSFMIFSNEAINELDLDYQRLLYGEELFIGEQCYRKHIPVKYVNSLKIMHTEHSSTSKKSNVFRKNKKYESIKYLYNMMFGDKNNRGA